MKKAFTLVEMVYTVAMIAVLASIVLFALNPTRQMGANRNLQRKNDLEQFDSAIRQYGIENRGRYPSEIRSIPLGETREFCKQNVEREVCENENLIYTQGSLSDILTSVPQDPQISEDENGTGYVIYWNGPSEFGFYAKTSELDQIQYIGVVPEDIISLL